MPRCNAADSLRTESCGSSIRRTPEVLVSVSHRSPITTSITSERAIALNGVREVAASRNAVDVCEHLRSPNAAESLSWSADT